MNTRPGCGPAMVLGATLLVALAFAYGARAALIALGVLGATVIVIAFGSAAVSPLWAWAWRSPEHDERFGCRYSPTWERIPGPHHDLGKDAGACRTCWPHIGPMRIRLAQNRLALQVDEAIEQDLRAILDSARGDQ